MELNRVLANVDAIRDELRDLPEVIDFSYEQRLLYLDTQLSVCKDYLASLYGPAEKLREVLERSHEMYRNRRVIQLSNEDPAKYKSVAKAEAQATSEEGYKEVIDKRADAISDARLIAKRMDSVTAMSNSIARRLNTLNSERIKFRSDEN